MYLNQRRIGTFRRKMCKTQIDFLVKSSVPDPDPVQLFQIRPDPDMTLRKISLIAILLPELADALTDGLRDIGQDRDGSPTLHAVLCI